MISKLNGIKNKIKNAMLNLNDFRTKRKTSSSQLFMEIVRECQDLLLPFS